jgi:hypothetical protein
VAAGRLNGHATQTGVIDSGAAKANPLRAAQSLLVHPLILLFLMLEKCEVSAGQHLCFTQKTIAATSVWF